MKELFYVIFGIILLAIGPQLILGIIFTAGIYYFLYMLFKGLISGSDSGSGDVENSGGSDAGLSVRFRAGGGRETVGGEFSGSSVSVEIAGLL